MALNGPQVAPLNDTAATGKATTVELVLLFGVADKYSKFLLKFFTFGMTRWH